MATTSEELDKYLLTQHLTWQPIPFAVGNCCLMDAFGKLHCFTSLGSYITPVLPNSAS